MTDNGQQRTMDDNGQWTTRTTDTDNGQQTQTTDNGQRMMTMTTTTRRTTRTRTMTPPSPPPRFTSRNHKTRLIDRFEAPAWVLEEEGEGRGGREEIQRQRRYAGHHHDGHRPCHSMPTGFLFFFFFS